MDIIFSGDTKSDFFDIQIKKTAQCHIRGGEGVKMLIKLKFLSHLTLSSGQRKLWHCSVLLFIQSATGEPGIIHIAQLGD